MREAHSSRVRNQGANVRKKFIDAPAFSPSVRESNRCQGIESTVEPPRREGEGGCIRPWLCAAGKQIRRVYGRHSMYKAGVVRRVNNGRQEKKTRAFGRQTRRFKARDRDLRRRSLRALFARTKAGAVPARKIASTCARWLAASNSARKMGTRSARSRGVCRGNRRFALNLLTASLSLERASTLNSLARQRRPVTMRRCASDAARRVHYNIKTGKKSAVEWRRMYSDLFQRR